MSVPGNGRVRSAKRSGARTSRELVKEFPSRDLVELYRFWAGKRGPKPPEDESDVRASILAFMSDAEVIEARIVELGSRLGAIFERHLSGQGYRQTLSELANARELNYLSNYDMEAAVITLVRHGLLCECGTRDERGYSVPMDLAEALVVRRRSGKQGIFETITLKGSLESRYRHPGRRGNQTPAQARMLYKVYSKESAAVSRVDRLPDGLRGLVEKSILQFGGILPKSLFERMETDLPHWNRRRWAKILEDSLVGTVERIDLSSYGIAHCDEALIVFTEVTLAWLKRVAVPGDPDTPAEEVSLGVDLASNISRFLSFLMENDVRFTVKGDIFKTTEKRIIGELIPNPGRELERTEVLDFIFSFCRAHRLVEPTGKRTFHVTQAGVEWEAMGLDQKLNRLVDFACEERPPSGGYFHQARMRRILLRLMKRVEDGTWYDIMYLPFLSRNTYIASLDDLAVEDYFAANNGLDAQDSYSDLQRLAWNLVRWVRRRLFLLGLVDLGYDAGGRPVAMRLTKTGARIFGAVGGDRASGMSGNLIVTSDFEVVLFPGGDDAELIHDLDRFCHREGSGEVMHFRINSKGVRRALHEGISLVRILDTLERTSRTPVPQNVLYSIRNWAFGAGLIYLDSERCLHVDDPETRKKLLQDPGVRPFVTRTRKEGTVQLKKDYTVKRLRALLRDLEYLVDLLK